MRAHAKWLMTSLACAYGLIRLQRRQCGTDWGSIILFRHIYIYIYIYMHVCMYACMHVCRSGVTRLGLRLHLPIRLNEASTECRMYVHVREKPVSYVCIPPLRFRGITKLCIPLPFSRILPPLRERKTVPCGKQIGLAFIDRKLRSSSRAPSLSLSLSLSLI